MVSSPTRRAAAQDIPVHDLEQLLHQERGLAYHVVVICHLDSNVTILSLSFV